MIIVRALRTGARIIKWKQLYQEKVPTDGGLLLFGKQLVAIVKMNITEIMMMVHLISLRVINCAACIE